MKRYDNYKPSGVEWLGEIPEHWEVKRVKDLGEYQSGYFIDAEEFDNENDFPVFGGNGLRGYADKYNHNGEYILIGRQGALCGNINYAIGKFWATEHAVVVYNKKSVSKRWYAYLLEIMNLNQYAISAAQPGLSVDKVKRLMLPYLNISEQTAIANYLDNKTAAIDRKIALLTTKADKYKALRRSLINETVCRGIRSESFTQSETLTKNKLKDSDIEWIGKIPEHWEVKRLKSFGEIETSSVDKKILESERLVKLVNYTDIYGNTTKEIWNSDDYMVVSANNKQVKSKVLRVGDVLFTPSSETIEDIGVSAVVMENLENTLYSYHILRFKFTDSVDLKFKKYMLNNDHVQYYFSKSASGSTRKILGLNGFLNLHVVLPPINEQTSIAIYLDEKTTQIDSILSNISQQISKLTQFRKILINEVVTGKIKVVEE